MLVLPLPVHAVGGRLFLDAQACNGLRLWLDNFDAVTMCNPLLEAASPPADTRDLREALPDARLTVVPLPAAWTPLRFFRVLPEVRRTLTTIMARSTDLQFAIGGLFGDWGAVAALLAARAGRRAAVWTDRVESQVMRFQARDAALLRRPYAHARAWATRHFERYVIRRSAMGLFHGMDTYNAYAQHSPDPRLVHDIHLGPEARIAPEALARKRARDEGRLRIVYGGRAHPDKGVADWIETLARAADAGIDFEATWFGSGPELDMARRRVAERGLADRVHFPGPTPDHAALIAELRAADLFLFCHKTRESPRCLVEALLSGTPIVGYDSDYPRDLIAANGGGLLTANEPAALAAALVALASDRARLRDLMARAARDGHPLVDVEVFRHRSDLIKSLASG